MASIDYEAEYNNRVRVPEHPSIFARWDADAAAYRTSALSSGRAELGVPYGKSERRRIDYFLPETDARPAAALFIHGGYWRAFDRHTFSHLAAGLNARGIAFAIAGYDLCPSCTIGDIIEQMRAAALAVSQRFGAPIVATGHSAGGHLAACLVATDWIAAGAGRPIVSYGYSISGLFDLAPMIKTAMNADLRLDETEARRASPLFWPAPRGAILDVAVGAFESGEFLRQSRDLSRAWSKAGAEARYIEIPGANHFTAIDPLADPGSAMVARIADLAERARAA